MTDPLQPIRGLGELLTAVKRIRNGWNPDAMNDEDFWFRGHSDGSYSLLPSLYRQDSIHAGYPDNEATLTQAFQLRSRAYIAQLGRTPPSPREWYVESRHHGLPTRLLDWTESVVVALYFAIECHWNELSRSQWFTHRDSLAQSSITVNDPCIWMLDAGTVNKLSQGYDGVYRLDTGEACVRDYFVESGKLVETSSNKLPIAIYPPRISSRITAQGGCFTLHGTCLEPLEIVAARNGGTCLLEKIPIDANAIPMIIDDLMLAGMYRDTVYPDMDSVAAYVKWVYHQ